jgi:hypothetical protein
LDENQIADATLVIILCQIPFQRLISDEKNGLVPMIVLANS